MNLFLPILTDHFPFFFLFLFPYYINKIMVKLMTQYLVIGYQKVECGEEITLRWYFVYSFLGRRIVCFQLSKR